MISISSLPEAVLHIAEAVVLLHRSHHSLTDVFEEEINVRLIDPDDPQLGNVEIVGFLLQHNIPGLAESG